mmetsp:Transcript_52974/g.123149  ORF Transcript_52974/g.123149 Transcript_52974/m.123149 type:complete len:254 (-) Transcript_52974:168-929(-)
MAVVLFQAVSITVAALVRDLSTHTHANSHCLAVKQRRVVVGPGQRLHRVADGVAVLRAHLIIVRLRVMVESRHLDLNRRLADISNVGRIEQHGLALFANGAHDALDEITTLTQTVLQSLRNTIANVARTQSQARCGINHNVLCGIVATKQVLAKVVVNRLLEIQSSIKHTHRSGGEVHQMDATVDHTCEHTAQIVHHATAYGDDARVLAHTIGQDGVNTGGEDLVVLEGFSRCLARVICCIRRDHNLQAFNTD